MNLANDLSYGVRRCRWEVLDDYLLLLLLPQLTSQLLDLRHRLES
jgi:hypothetical protein